MDHVVRRWTAPIFPVFEYLITVAENDGDIESAIKSTLERLPEIWDMLDTESFADALSYAREASFVAGWNSYKLEEKVKGTRKRNYVGKN